LVPPTAQLAERREVESVGGAGVAAQFAFPLPEPEPIGAVHVGEHLAQRRGAELLADLTPRRLFAERGGHLEEPAVRPVVVVPQLADQLDRHPTSLTAHAARGRRHSPRAPGTSSPRAARGPAARPRWRAGGRCRADRPRPTPTAAPTYRRA